MFDINNLGEIPEPKRKPDAKCMHVKEDHFSNVTKGCNLMLLKAFEVWLRFVIRQSVF